MKSVLCEFDKSGRIIIPHVFRKHITSSVSRKVEVMLTASGILLKRPDISCALCGDPENLTEFDNNYICQNCIQKILFFNTRGQC